MSDELIIELRRIWNNSGNLEDELAYRREQLRSSDDDRSIAQLDLASVLLKLGEEASAINLAHKGLEKKQFHRFLPELYCYNPDLCNQVVMSISNGDNVPWDFKEVGDEYVFQSFLVHTYLDWRGFSYEDTNNIGNRFAGTIPLCIRDSDFYVNRESEETNIQKTIFDIESSRYPFSILGGIYRKGRFCIDSEDFINRGHPYVVLKQDFEIGSKRFFIQWNIYSGEEPEDIWFDDIHGTRTMPFPGYSNNSPSKYGWSYEPTK